MKSVCHVDENCPMTAGYYIGGGMWICWLHALKHLPFSVVAMLKCVALPKVNQRGKS